ncbi:hypothetical protein [uncultured Megasphaera sp.]|nr:hypothetical protein [uncultured Megasphaera sp.]
MKRYLPMIVLAITMTFIFDWNKHMVEVALFYAVWGLIMGRMTKE